MTTIAQAIALLRPEAQFVIENDDVQGITWIREPDVSLTEAEITAEISRLQATHEATAYKHKRAAEYPPITDYIDGVVKGDEAQMQAYIDACLAVKAKYPKPSA